MHADPQIQEEMADGQHPSKPDLMLCRAEHQEFRLHGRVERHISTLSSNIPESRTSMQFTGQVSQDGQWHQAGKPSRRWRLIGRRMRYSQKHSYRLVVVQGVHLRLSCYWPCLWSSLMIYSCLFFASTVSVR